MPVKAIIFDLGGVLVELDYSNFYNRIISLSPLENPHTRHTHAMLDFFKQSDLYHQGKMSDEEFFKFSCDLLQISLSSQSEFYDAFNSIISREMPEMTELLRDLKDLGKYKLIGLSNVNSSHWKYLLEKDWPFLEYFNELILSFKIHITKPNPEVFQLAIKKAGCQPEEIVFIDDGFNNTRSAKEQGINPIHFTNKEELIEDLKKLNVII